VGVWEMRRWGEWEMGRINITQLFSYQFSILNSQFSILNSQLPSTLYPLT
jgi:hypothetical protein